MLAVWLLELALSTTVTLTVDVPLGVAGTAGEAVIFKPLPQPDTLPSAPRESVRITISTTAFAQRRRSGTTSKRRPVAAIPAKDPASPIRLT